MEGRQGSPPGQRNSQGVGEQVGRREVNSMAKAAMSRSSGSRAYVSRAQGSRWREMGQLDSPQVQAF